MPSCVRVVHLLVPLVAGLLVGGCMSPTVTYKLDYMSPAAEFETRQQVEVGLAAIVQYLHVEPRGQITVTDISPLAKLVPTTTSSVKQTTGRAFAHRVTLPVPGGKGVATNAIIHEFTHVVASAHGNPLSIRWFLSEGLAVHVHGVLSPTDDPMSFDKFPIHKHALTIVGQLTDKSLIERLFNTNISFTAFGVDDKRNIASTVAYVLAGSFVTYLIQRDGPEGERAAIDKFMKVYKDGCLQCAFGKPIGSLQQDWIAFLQDAPLARTRPLPPPEPFASMDDLIRLRTRP